MNFKNLHYQKKPVLIGNVWDVPSVKIAEKLNFQAIGTSSAAIAKLLGYKDGEEMAFSEMEYMVKQIAHHTNVPLSVDLESGYSRNPAEIVDHIKRLAALGVVGINIEDSIVHTERTLLAADAFAKTINTIKKQLDKEDIHIFINVRTDTFILCKENVLEETKKRIQLYEHAGADGIFVPCIEKAQGTRKSFDVALETPGTDFQNKVWNALQNIDYGTTTSYQQQANTIGNPKAVRAVASANGNNRIAIIIPCHRVIGKNGKITGYSGGIERKMWLIRHEKACLNVS